MTGRSGITRILATGLLAVATLAFTACEDDGDLAPAVVATPTLEATPTPEPTPTPVPEIEINSNKNELRAMVPAGPLASEPYRVYTGDGDCLNVRPSPGVRFQGDPRACVPEGFLLWLYGDPIEVDGFTWRYALGEGWVATQYVKADPGSKDVLSKSIPDLVVSTTDGVEDHYSRVDKSGKVTPLLRLPWNGESHIMQPVGGKPGFVATGGRDASTSTPGVVLTRLDTGAKSFVPYAYFLGWSDDGKAFLKVGRNGQELAYVEPGSPPVFLGPEPSGMGTSTWMPGGESILVTGEASTIYEFETNASAPRTILGRDNSRPYLGDIAVSPDGSTLISTPYVGPLQLLSLKDGSLREFPRAPQVSRQGGGCGVGWGKLSVWLDNDTVAWHEAYAEKGSNGITIGDLESGKRTVVPFFILQDIVRIDDKTLSFTTQESIATVSGSSIDFPVVWVLDIESGEARPITAGMTSARRGV